MFGDILERIGQEALISPEENLQKEYDELKKQFVIDPNVEYPEPEYLIEIGGVPTLPKGNLVALNAKWKNGKTFFCDVLSAIFLGSNMFGGCRSLMPGGKVRFYDTEQADSDTARIEKTIKAMVPTENCTEERLQVFNLRGAAINDDYENSNIISRINFLKKSIRFERPDLAIVDGIADLIYNFNDVIESQEIVNDLARLASKYNCCIVVVMHQNKSIQDKNMKGHLGTILFQKCSDVFSVEKMDSIFIATHTVTRHRNCDDIVFRLNTEAVPMDAANDRQLELDMQRELRQQSERAKLHEKLVKCFEGINNPISRTDIVNLVQAKLGVGSAQGYRIVKAAINTNLLVTDDTKNFYLAAAE